MTVMLASGRYFALALIRIPLLVPALGERWAELLEMPLMLLWIWWAAGQPARRLASVAQRLGCGALALVWLLLTEFTVVLWLRDMSLESYFASRDPLAGGVYAASLVLLALMPWWRGRSAASAEG